MKLRLSLCVAALLAAFCLPCAAQMNPDPCSRENKTKININQTANTLLQSNTAGMRIYVCSVFIAPMATATNIGFLSGTGSVCATGTAAAITGGDGTAAKGANIAANGGFLGGNGAGAIDIIPSGKDLCLNQSAANQISGTLMIVIAP